MWSSVTELDWCYAVSDMGHIWFVWLDDDGAWKVLHSPEAGAESYFEDVKP